MSGHAFQVLVTDAAILEHLRATAAALVPGGSFAFETRNRDARLWERWTPENPWEFEVDGVDASYVANVRGTIEQGVVTFDSEYHRTDSSEPLSSTSSLRFLSAAELDVLLASAGLHVTERCGDWDRSALTESSPEIITIAKRSN